MADEIAPALTPIGWKRALLGPEWLDELAGQLPAMLSQAADGNTGEWDTPRHAAAALALHGQPFGFTRADVELVCLGIDAYWARVPEPPRDDPTWPYWDTQRRWRSLAARIAALLPPE